MRETVWANQGFLVLVTFKLTLVKVGHQQMEEKMQHLKQGTAFSEGTETRHYSMKWQDYWRDVKTRQQEGLE